MKKVFVLVLLLPSLTAASPESKDIIFGCDLQVKITDGRNTEGLPIRGEDLKIALPCVDKNKMVEIVTHLGMTRHEDEKTAVLTTLKKAKTVTLILSNAVARQD